MALRQPHWVWVCRADVLSQSSIHVFCGDRKRKATSPADLSLSMQITQRSSELSWGGSLSLSRKMLCAWRFFPDQAGFYLSREETGFSSRERILPVLPKSFSLGREADASWSKDCRRTLRGKEWVFLMPCFFCVPPRIVEGMGGASQHRVAASGRNALFVLCFYYR